MSSDKIRVSHICFPRYYRTQQTEKVSVRHHFDFENLIIYTYDINFSSRATVSFFGSSKVAFCQLFY